MILSSSSITLWKYIDLATPKFCAILTLTHNPPFFRGIGAMTTTTFKINRHAHTRTTHTLRKKKRPNELSSGGCCVCFVCTLGRRHTTLCRVRCRGSNIPREFNDTCWFGRWSSKFPPPPPPSPQIN